MIIFDLDDTLIDTSGSITPYKMKECLKRFIALGVQVASFEHAYAELISMNAKSYRSKDALIQFLHKQKAESVLIDQVIDEMVKPLPAHFSIQTTPYAKEILEILSKSHTLALVTGGHPPFQMEKLEKAGIDSAIFSKIAIPEDSIKKPFYEQIIQDFLLPPKGILVCGDRVAMDLLPAFELGLTTVHMRWGRGKITETEKWVDHTISDLSELKRIVKI